jgi:hypothetical protein
MRPTKRENQLPPTVGDIRWPSEEESGKRMGLGLIIAALTEQQEGEKPIPKNRNLLHVFFTAQLLIEYHA